jgi:hypothetical protein
VLYWGNRCFRFGGANKAERSDALGAAVEVKPVPKQLARTNSIRSKSDCDQQRSAVDHTTHLQRCSGTDSIINRVSSGASSREHHCDQLQGNQPFAEMRNANHLNWHSNVQPY